MADKPKLLIIEDDLGLCSQYRWAFPDCQVLFAHNREQALSIAQKERPPVAIMDLGLPPDPDGVSEGFATLDGLVKMIREMKIIVATSHDDRTHAMRAIAAGAYDFCEKPIDIQVLNTIVQRGLRLRTLEEDNRRLMETVAPSPIKKIVTADEGMLKICRDIEKLASHKRVGSAARRKWHRQGGARARVARPRPARAATVCGDQLRRDPGEPARERAVWHERGAFTGAVKQTQGRIEMANKGTLFLDEIGDLPHPLQVKLLRFLQDQVVERIGGRTSIQVDVRVVSATNAQLQDHVDAGRFRGDLFYRLNPITLRIPPTPRSRQ